MDAMVTARVPVEIKKQGDRKLREIGSSATELVNAAYRYVLENGRLPRERPTEAPGEGGLKKLTGDAARKFAGKWQARAVLDAPEYDGGNFKELLDRARDEYHARLA